MIYEDEREESQGEKRAKDKKKRGRGEGYTSEIERALLFLLPAFSAPEANQENNSSESAYPEGKKKRGCTTDLTNRDFSGSLDRPTNSDNRD